MTFRDLLPGQVFAFMGEAITPLGIGRKGPWVKVTAGKYCLLSEYSNMWSETKPRIYRTSARAKVRAVKGEAS